MSNINRTHKDRLFRFLFGGEANREWTLNLFNAVNGTGYANPEDIQITTIDDAIYMGMKNDLSFILYYVMNIYEQQSTFNPNMPVRQLMYAGKLYDKYIHMNKLNIYGRKTVRLPVPRLVVFYNGTEGMEDTVLKLSDAFGPDAALTEPDIEVKVRMININYGKNSALLKACKPLAEYAWLVEEITKNRRDMDIDSAVDKALDNMPEDYVIKPFLMGNRAEVQDMCITEYNEAETMRMLRQEGLEEGRKEGRSEGEDKLGKLVSLLLSKGRNDDIQKAAVDQEARMALYEEFGIL